MSHEKGYLSNGTDAEECESFLKEEDITGQKTSAKLGVSAIQKTKAYLLDLNWKSIAITACLWIAVLICSAEYSIVAPFFPQEVILGLFSRYLLQQLYT